LPTEENTYVQQKILCDPPPNCSGLVGSPAQVFAFSAPSEGMRYSAEYSRWKEQDLDSAAGAVRGFRLAVGLGAAIWVLLVILFYGVTHV
jgi:hypothetical protein